MTDAKSGWKPLLGLAAIVLAACTTYWFVNESDSAGLHLKITKLRSVKTKVSPTGIAWSPNGEKIAAMHDFGRAMSVWNSSSEPIVSIKREVTTGPYVGSSLAFMPDSRTILAPAPTPTHYPTSSLGLWDAETGAIQRIVPAPSYGKIYQAIVADIFALSPDGTMVAFQPIDGREPISIYRTSDWSLVKVRQILKSETVGLKPSRSNGLTPGGLPDNVSALAFAPNHDLAVGLMNGLAIVESDQSSTSFRFFESEYRLVHSLAYSPDGSFIAVGMGISLAKKSEIRSAFLQIRDSASGNIVVEDNTIAEVKRLAWDRDGKILAVITNDEAVHLYRPFTSGSAHQDVPVSKGAFTLAFSPAKSELAVSTETGVDFYSVR